MSVFLTTIAGFTIPAVNLKDVCNAKAAGVSVTFTAFYIVSIEQLYNDAFSWFIVGAFVLATDEHTPVHLNVFFVDNKNFKTKFYVY